MQASPDVAIKAVKEKIAEIDGGTQQIISTYRKDRPKEETDKVTATGADKSAAKPVASADVEAVKWAYANPNDPRAKAIKLANGIK